ncbi:hypothetical protein P4050_15955 [Pseudomonas aeruginosa]|nr:hypothetical protein [Pseudomonas aeruginosa]
MTARRACSSIEDSFAVRDELVGPFGAFALDEEVTQAAQDPVQSRHRVGRFREFDD